MSAKRTKKKTKKSRAIAIAPIDSGACAVLLEKHLADALRAFTRSIQEDCHVADVGQSLTRAITRRMCQHLKETPCPEDADEHGVGT